MSISTVQKGNFSEISEESMSTIKNIVNCLPKTYHSRNNRNNFLFKDEIIQNNSIEKSNVFTKDKYIKKSSNQIFFDTASNCSSCSSSCSGKMENISKYFGKQNYNYSNVKNKSKLINKYFIIFA